MIGVRAGAVHGVRAGAVHGVRVGAAHCGWQLPSLGEVGCRVSAPASPARCPVDGGHLDLGLAHDSCARGYDDERGVKAKKITRLENLRPDVPESIRPVLGLGGDAPRGGGAVSGASGVVGCAGDAKCGTCGKYAGGVGCAGCAASGCASGGGTHAGGEGRVHAADCASTCCAGADCASGGTEQTALGAVDSARGERGRVAPLSAGRFHVEFTMTAATKDKLEQVLDLMSHGNPRHSLATAFDRALEVLLRDLEKQRLGKTARPRKSRGAKHGNFARSTLRAVYARDGVQCAFVSEAGVRRTSRVFLQTDHVVARALGGSGEVLNARVLCRPHNLYEAERTFGQAHVARKIRERRGDAPGCGGCDGWSV